MIVIRDNDWFLRVFQKSEKRDVNIKLLYEGFKGIEIQFRGIICVQKHLISLSYKYILMQLHYKIIVASIFTYII